MPSDEYWKSPQGIKKRVEMLGEDFSYRLINNALQVYGHKNFIVAFEWEGYIDKRTCAYCDSQIGRQYLRRQFLPSLPAHAGCRCSWRLVKK